MKQKPHPIRWVIWGLAVAFYFYEYFLRVIPSVMVQPLMETFHLTAKGIGLLSAFYFFAYAPMQLPVGILMDRFGARKLLTFATITCGLFSILFAVSQKVFLIDIARFFTGLGSAFAFIGVVYLSSHLFSHRKLASLVGIGNSLGMLGAVFGLGPFSLMESTFGWRQTLWVLGILGLLLGLAIFIVIKLEPKCFQKCDRKKSTPVFLSHFKSVLTNKYTWLNAFIAFFFYSITSSFAGLWAVPFLHHVYGFDMHTASFGGSLFFVGWIIGGPIIGHYSDKMKRRKPLLIGTAIGALFSILLLVYFPIWPKWGAYFFIFLLGLFGSGQLLCYSLAIDLNTQVAKGSAVAFTNFIVFLGGCALQPFVGFLLDLSWQKKVIDNMRIYSQKDYQIALICFPISLVLAIILSFFLKKKRIFVK